MHMSVLFTYKLRLEGEAKSLQEIWGKGVKPAFVLCLTLLHSTALRSPCSARSPPPAPQLSCWKWIGSGENCSKKQSKDRLSVLPPTCFFFIGSMEPIFILYMNRTVMCKKLWSQYSFYTWLYKSRSDPATLCCLLLTWAMLFTPCLGQLWKCTIHVGTAPNTQIL